MSFLRYPSLMLKSCGGLWVFRCTWIVLNVNFTYFWLQINCYPVYLRQGIVQEDSRQEYQEAFNSFDWSHSGKISYSNLQVDFFIGWEKFKTTLSLTRQAAMRRCGHNPTDIEVSDIINKIHNDSGSLDFEVCPASLKIPVQCKWQRKVQQGVPKRCCFIGT